jgi:hypothetical protein
MIRILCYSLPLWPVPWPLAVLMTIPVDNDLATL